MEAGQLRGSVVRSKDIFGNRSWKENVRGKKMAVIGDSVAQNHFESLLCLLSQEESPEDIYKDFEDHFGTWIQHFQLQLDKVDDKWAEHLPDAIFSAGNWFNRVMYLHEGGNLIGWFYCRESNVTDYNSSHVVHLAFRTAFKHIIDCKDCKGALPTLLRTFALAHFEGGVWNTGGYCNRTSPLSEALIDLGRSDWEMRSIQVEEIEGARKEGEMQGKKFKVLDVTRAMLMRPDAHPGAHWNKWTDGYNDCVHWCMPGPIDYWNHFLMEIIKIEGGIVS